VLDEIRDPVGDDPRFPAARARKDQHWTLDGLDGLTLLRIQLIKKRQSGNGSGGDSILQGNENRRGRKGRGGSMEIPENACVLGVLRGFYFGALHSAQGQISRKNRHE